MPTNSVVWSHGRFSERPDRDLLALPFLFGGDAMKYSDKLKDPRWQKKRLEILEERKWLCESCGDGKKTLHVHHKYYDYDKDPWDYQSQAYSVLCEECHEDEHFSKKRVEDQLIKCMRKHFLNDEIVSISSGFDCLVNYSRKEIISGVIAWVISNQDIMDNLTKSYLEIIKQQYE